jgi:hypothetical protein
MVILGSIGGEVNANGDCLRGRRIASIDKENPQEYTFLEAMTMLL